MLSPLEDPRNSLEKMRRAKLYPILRDHGIQVKPDAPITHMRELVHQYGVDIRKKPMKKAIEKKAEERIEDMRMPDLRRLAKERGLSQAPTDKKTDLIRKLNGENAA